MATDEELWERFWDAHGAAHSPDNRARYIAGLRAVADVAWVEGRTRGYTPPVGPVIESGGRKIQYHMDTGTSPYSLVYPEGNNPE